ncbi:hypothetical protein BH20ACT6_BH20ACT6_16860 [soil metagenome]
MIYATSTVVVDRRCRVAHRDPRTDPRVLDSTTVSDTPEAASPSISRADVAHLAELARIDLTEAELDHLAPQLSVIVESVARVSEVAGDEVPPTSHPLPVTNVFRDDVVRPGLSADEALAAAPSVEQQRFSVPQILGEEA